LNTIGLESVAASAALHLELSHNAVGTAAAPPAIAEI
jgi:hypothetical protein